MRILIPIFLAAAAMCHGSVLNVSFVSDTLIGNPGDTVQFFGSLTNTTNSTVFITSDNIPFALPTGVDDSPFFANSPLSLGTGASAFSGIFEFMDITIPLGQASGTYDGNFIVIGGLLDGANDPVGAAAFHVTVNSLTPEPASTILVGLGLAGASLLARRNRNLKASRN
jgi:hypothetical protein